jgi:hypothetical protein
MRLKTVVPCTRVYARKSKKTNFVLSGSPFLLVIWDWHVLSSEPFPDCLQYWRSMAIIMII